MNNLQGAVGRTVVVSDVVLAIVYGSNFFVTRYGTGLNDSLRGSLLLIGRVSHGTAVGPGELLLRRR